MKDYLKKGGHFSLFENDYNEYKLQYNKEPVEEILIQRAVKITIEILYERGNLIVFPMQIRF